MSDPNVVGQIMPDNTDTPGPIDKTKPRLTKALPTDRLSWEKQLLLLRCFAIAAAGEGKLVSAAELAKLSNLNISSAGLNNTFFADLGLLSKVGQGYVPSAEVVSYERAYQFNAETAGQKLAPAPLPRG